MRNSIPILNVWKILLLLPRTEQQIERRKRSKHRIPYLIINRNSDEKNRDKTIFADYWTTTGERANKINPFAKLEAYRGTAFRPESLALVTGTIAEKTSPRPVRKYSPTASMSCQRAA